MYIVYIYMYEYTYQYTYIYTRKFSSALQPGGVQLLKHKKRESLKRQRATKAITKSLQNLPVNLLQHITTELTFGFFVPGGNFPLHPGVVGGPPEPPCGKSKRPKTYIYKGV